MNILEMGGNALIAASKFAKYGFPILSREDYLDRYAKCNEPCEFLKNNRCTACGCFTVKLWLATESCPKGKWHSKVQK